MSGILDQATAKQAQAIDPGASVWVSASAGTGKTKVLTDRVLALLLAGTLPQRILCLTFTKAAAAEMSLRLLAMLSHWTIAEDAQVEAQIAPLLTGPVTPDHMRIARQLFARVLDVPGGMHIETIHAFCQSLLRRFPVEAGLSPHFQVMDDTDAQEILAECQHHVLAEAQSARHPALSAALKDVTDRIHESRFADLMTALTRNRGQIAAMLRHHHSVDGVIAALSARLDLAPQDTPETVIAAACAEDRIDGPGLRQALAAMITGKSTDQKAAALMEPWLAHTHRRVDLFADYTKAFLTQEFEPRKRLLTADIVKKFPHLADVMDAEALRLMRVYQRLNAVETRLSTRALLTLGQALLHIYQQKKERLSTLDYDDLIYHARQLLERPGISPWVLFKLDGGLDHVLIDEAQDTNPDQWAVIRALTQEFFAGHGGRDEVRTIFAVGDAKQSIYSFQRADPAEFAAMRQFFSAKVTAANRTWRDVDLLVSFRSAPAVLEGVNAMFGPSGVARYGVAAAEEDITHLPARQGQASTVEVWPPVAMRACDAPAPWKPPVERIRADSPSQRLAHLLAERMAAMIGTQMLASRGRPIRAGDIMVLVRRRGGFVEDLIRALKARDLPVAGADRMVLADQIAVMDLMALGQCLLQPHDDLTLATVLKGPLMGLTEDQLFHLAWDRKTNLWDTLRLQSELLPHLGLAWERLAQWQLWADRLTPFEFYSAVLGADGGRRRLSARLGLEADDPLDEFLSLALTFQHSHPPSLQGFLHWLTSAGIEIKRDLEQGNLDAVRIMTVHGSKGLQAPIVFLPDTMQVPKAGTDPLYWLDPHLLSWPPRAKTMDVCSAEAKEHRTNAQQQEYHRLLYVAATRAEDHLIVCGFMNRAVAADNWHDAIQQSLAPIAATITDPVLDRIQETESSQIALLSSSQTAVPDRQRDHPIVCGQSLAPLPEWAILAPEQEPMPPRPLAPSRPHGEEQVVRSPLVALASSLSYRRGSLIHRLLQTLPSLPTAERSAAGLRYLTNAAPEMTPGQRIHLLNEVQDVMDDVAFHHVFQPQSLAEVPVAGLIGDRAIAGVVDRLAVSDSHVLIVDYKTNRRPPAADQPVPESYVRQMAAYRMALACIYPHHKIRCAIIWTDGPLLREIEPSVMDDCLVH